MPNAEKKCPFCGEMIKFEAIKCRFCGEFLDKIPAASAANPMPASAPAPAPAIATGPVPPVVPANPPAPAQPAAPAVGTSDEKHIYKGPLSGVIMIWPVVALIFWVAAAVALIIFGENLAVKTGLVKAEQIKNIPTYVAAGIAALALFWFLYKWLLFRSRTYLITSERIEYEYGILFKAVQNMDMWRVQDIGFTQSFLDRVLGVGYINIQSSDTSDPHICVGPIGGPRAVYDAMKKVQLDADRKQRVVHVEK